MGHIKLPLASVMHLAFQKLAFSFASTSEEASGGTEGQTAGLGQGSMLSEALPIEGKDALRIIAIIKTKRTKQRQRQLD